MKIRCLPLYVCMATGLMAFTPTTGVSATSDLGPHVVLKATQRFSGHFTHEHPVEGFQAPMRSEGRFTIDGNDKIIWAIEKPMMTTTTITDQGLTQSVGNYTLLRVSANKMPFLAEIQRNVLWALSGRWDRLKNDFVINTSGSKSSWEVVITPREDSPTIKPFQKLIAQGSGDFMTMAEVVLPSGTIDHLTFSDQMVSP